MKRKFWKNIFSLLMCFLLAIAAAVPCFAQENNQVVTTYTEDLGNGITVVTTIAKTVTRSTTSTTKTKDYYSGGQKIGRAALYKGIKVSNCWQYANVLDQPFLQQSTKRSFAT